MESDESTLERLVAALEHIVEHIQRTRRELGALQHSGAADELEEIVSETARAANEIMAAAESVEAVAAGTDPAVREALQAAATRIYEASAFQDITGQRIAKVVRALQHIESRVDELTGAGSGPGGDTLLNGPQLGRNAATQSEIDSLFESMP
jgi:chemotaxis protein CheZ